MVTSAPDSSDVANKGTQEVIKKERDLDTRTVEDIIIAQTQEQGKNMADRSAQLNILQQQLNKSLAKKQEVDVVVSREIDGLRSRIKEIEIVERDGLVSMQKVLSSLREAAESKNELIAESNEVVKQLEDVLSKVSEASIASLLETSITQKRGKL